MRFTPPIGEPERARDERKRLGSYYTPPEIARLIVGHTLQSHWNGDVPPQVLDPACGAGELLLEAMSAIRARFGASAARSAIRGVDIDSAAVAQARSRLQTADPRFAIERISRGDALDANLLPAESFDAIVGNPPYINIRQLAKRVSRRRIDELRQRFQTARGNFDLYVLFIEQALSLLRPGGRCGLIVPNKWATLDYARPCRDLLLSTTTIEQVVDLTAARPFAKAAVYPQILIFRKSPPRRSHAIACRTLAEAAAPRPPARPARIRQAALSAIAISLAPPLDIESRVPTRPLGELATLSCGTAGYAAQRIARKLVEGGPPAGTAQFITTGNIDRYALRLGDVRYLNRTYSRPRLPLDIPEITAAKRQLFRSPKIVIAGMSRRLEAAWDAAGLALGVQVFAATNCLADPYFVLALLNSKLLSYLFALRYAAKRLGGGYLAINKGQLVRLPICVVDAGDARAQHLARRLASLAAARSQVIPAGIERPASKNVARFDIQEPELDLLVYDLYQLRDSEIANVEAHFADRVAKAA